RHVDADPILLVRTRLLRAVGIDRALSANARAHRAVRARLAARRRFARAVDAEQACLALAGVVAGAAPIHVAARGLARVTTREVGRTLFLRWAALGRLLAVEARRIGGALLDQH